MCLPMILKVCLCLLVSVTEDLNFVLTSFPALKFVVKGYLVTNNNSYDISNLNYAAEKCSIVNNFTF